ncbi:MAG: beta-propeller fold lactonase family protein [Candidatus Babeliales bacterium]
MNKCSGVLISMLFLVHNAVYGATAYVTQRTDVVVFDTTTNTVTQKITDASFVIPQQLAITPDGSTVYVVDAGDGLFNFGSVTIINVATNTVEGIVTDLSTTFNQPFGIAITPNGKTAYVTNFAGASVSVIDIASNTVTQAITSFGNPQGIAITPNGTMAYVVDNGNNTVSVIAIPGNTVTDVISDPSFNSPQLIAIAPDGSKAYVTNESGNSVSVIAIPANTVTTVTNPNFVQPFGVAISPDGSKAYVTNDAITPFVSVIDVANNQVDSITPTVLSPNFNLPKGVVFTPDGTTAYVANNRMGNSSVSIINAATNTVTAQGVVTDSSSFFNQPFFIAIVPGSTPPTPTASITVSGVQQKNIFLTQTDYINVITWTTPTTVTPVSYQLYRDAALTDLAGTVPANGPLRFKDHNRNPKLTYTYYLVAVDQAGNKTLLGNVTVVGLNIFGS